MIRLKAIALPYDHTTDAINRLATRQLGLSKGDIISIDIVKRSIDARRKSNIQAIYTADITSSKDENTIKLPPNAEVITKESKQYKMPTGSDKDKNIVIAGSGPCGLMAAIMLARLGYKPTIIERGKPVEERIKDVQDFWQKGILNPESNVQFGEGGAGTFSDGKLASQVKDKLNRSRKVLQELVTAGAPEEIMYQAKPHIGTDNLIKVVRNMRNEIISLGGKVLFETKLTGIKTTGGKISGVIINDSDCIDTENLILAIGHSSRDTFEMLHNSGATMEAKPFSIGVRIEHPQELINKSQYNFAQTDPILGAAEYKLVHHCPNGRSAYTFCMCPGGEVIASSSEPQMLVTNGMSHYRRNRPNANSALLVGITPADFSSDSPLAGIEFQRQWERKAFILGGSNYSAPVQLVGDFLRGKSSTSIASVKPSYTPGTTPCDISETLPQFVTDTLRLAIPQMDKKLRGFASDDAIMTAIESRSSCPLRILRDQSFQNPAIAGLYPAGEGAGYAGGIMSAAMDGIKVAEAVIS